MKDILQTTLKLTTVAIVAASFAYGSGFAAEKDKTKSNPSAPACNSLKEEAPCMAREDCSWIAASVDSKTQKVKRKAYCRAKPKPKPKPTTAPKTKAPT